MRIVAELPRPDCKITIFSMNARFLVKFEKGYLEQTYKLSELDLLDGVNSVFELLDEPFIQSVVARFSDMKRDFSETYNRH
jgi:hypothetical protein